MKIEDFELFFQNALKFLSTRRISLDHTSFAPVVLTELKSGVLASWGACFSVIFLIEQFDQHLL